MEVTKHFLKIAFRIARSGRISKPVASTLAARAGATGTDRAVAVTCSLATHWLLRLAADHPDRVLGAVASGTNLPLAPGHERPEAGPFLEPYRSTEGWAKFNADYWRTDYEGFLRFFFSQVWTEPHSEGLIDTCVENGLGTTPETLIDTIGANPMTAEEALALIRRTRCPWLVVHGDRDELQPHARAVRLAEEAGASLVTLAGAGHCSGNRDPVRFNLLIRDFTEEILPWRPRRRTWTRTRSRPRSVLIVPGASPAVERDRRIAEALRARRPGVRIAWFAAGPAARQLADFGEMVHPASADLPIFPDQGPDPFSAWRESDEAHFLTFMILHDVAAEEPVDLVVADGAWGVDHYLYENPELKQYAYAWLTDAIGWLPEPDADERRRYLMTNANAEMLEQVERYPRVRDRAVFLGRPEDLPDTAFGPGLPGIRDWSAARFAFSGPLHANGAIDRAAAFLAELL